MNSMVQSLPPILEKIRSQAKLPLEDIFEETRMQLIAARNGKAVDEPVQEEKVEVVEEEDRFGDESQDLEFGDSGPEEEQPEELNTSLTDLAAGLGDTFENNFEAIKTSFFEAIENNYNKMMIRPTKKLGESPLGSSLLDELSLVDHEELELQIVVNHAESTMLESHRHDVTSLCMRFEKVLGYELDVSKLPLSPIGIGHAFMHAISGLDLDQEQKKLALLSLLVTYKLRCKAILDAANKVMLDHNILPDLSQEDTAIRQKKEEAKKEAKEKRNELLGIEDDDVEISGEIAKFLQQVDIPEEAQQHVIKTDVNAPKISQAELAAKIDLLKSLQAQVEENGVYYKPDESGVTLAEKLADKAEMEKYGLDETSSKTISIISMSFEKMLADENIPSPIKGLLEQLQAPLLKAAVQDQQFFGDIENSAQQFVNNIMKASQSWSPEQNAENDALYKKMAALVDKVNTDFDDDYLIFDDAIVDFDSFNQAEAEKASKMEDRMIDRLSAEERIKAANDMADQHVQERFDQLAMPAAIRQFFSSTWRYALFFIFNAEASEESEEWLDAIEIENTLLANMQDAQEEDIEVFMDILHEKLIDCGIDENEANTQVKKVEAALIECNINPEILESLPTDQASPEPVVQDQQAVEEEEVAELVIEEEEFEDGFSREEIIERLQIGAWFQKNTVAPPIRVKIAAHIKFNDSYVMVFRNGMKENVYSTDQLVGMIKLHEFIELDNQLLFDSALESVISEIR